MDRGGEPAGVGLAPTADGIPEEGGRVHRVEDQVGVREPDGREVGGLSDAILPHFTALHCNY